jgi:transposase
MLSLVARIDELSEQNKNLLEQITTLLAQNSMLLARIAELEARGGKPPKTPTNSSVPPSRGQKGNVGDASGEKKGRKGRPGVARELCPNPDVTHNIFAERCDCGGKVTHKGQVLTHAYDHVELPPIKPTTTRIKLHSADLRGEPGSRAELSFRLPNLSR